MASDDRKLTGDEKRVVRQMYEEGRSVSEIAQYLGRPPYLVEKRIEQLRERSLELRIEEELENGKGVQFAKEVGQGIVHQIAEEIRKSDAKKKAKKARKKSDSPLTAGVALLGLAIIFLVQTPFLPSILVLGSLIAVTDGLEKGRLLKGLEAATWMMGIGITFLIGGQYFLPLLFLTLGVGSLVSGVFKKLQRTSEDEESEDIIVKRKNDEIARREDEDNYYEKPKRGRMQLTDDGELVDIVDGSDEDGALRQSQELR